MKGSNIPKWLDKLEKEFWQDINFLLSQDENIIEIVEVGPIWSKDPFMCVKKDVVYLLNSWHRLRKWMK